LTKLGHGSANRPDQSFLPGLGLAPMVDCKMPEVSSALPRSDPAPREKSAKYTAKPPARRLPDFRNLGVISRILLSVNALALLFAVARSREIGEFAVKVTEIAGSLEPVLLARWWCFTPCRRCWSDSTTSRGWQRCSRSCSRRAPPFFRFKRTSAEATSSAISRGTCFARPPRRRWWLVFSPAQSRVFACDFRGAAPGAPGAYPAAFPVHSLNAVLSLIRKDPKRAEGALEDLAELFRTVMADNRQLVALRDEVSLCRQYLNLEQLRLGERLRVEWRLDPAPTMAWFRPCFCSPWSRTPSITASSRESNPALIEVRVERRSDGCGCSSPTPITRTTSTGKGTTLALANIRERLQLHFDVEASLNTRIADGRYEIGIAMPYRTGP